MRKKRVVSTIVFFYGEGETEEVFLWHLARLYARGNISPKIDHNGGGSPSSIADKAIRKKSHRGPFAASVIICDADKISSDAQFQRSKVLAEQDGFRFIVSRPCIEALFLEILNQKIPWSSKTTLECEKSFYPQQAKCKPIDSGECERLFSMVVLNAARKRMKDLDELIEYFEGK